MGSRLGWLAWIILAVAWFATVPVRPMLDPDEGRYAEIPREMLASGDWVTPRFDDLKYFEKPPLQYWATAVAYEAFGLKEWSSRLWGVGLAFACLPLVFAWVARLYGREGALLALTALAVSPFFVIIGHLNLLDGSFTFWLTAAVLAFTLAQTLPAKSRAERRWMLIAWAAAALALLSKGIVVGALAGAALSLYTLSERDTLTWRRLHLLPGLALFLVLAAPWFIMVSLRNPSFPEFFFVHEHVTRFLTTVHQRVEPWWYFLPLLLLGVLPWIAPLVRAGRRAWQDAALNTTAGASVAAASEAGRTRFRPLKFLLIFAAVTLLFFSASGSKLAPYILPMLPVLAVVTGAASCAGGEFARHAARIGAGLIVFIAAGLLVYSARRNSYVPQQALLWALAAAVAALVAVAVTFRTRPSIQTPAAIVTAASAILAWQCLLCEYTLIPPSRSARDLVSAARPFIRAHTPLYSVGQYRETVSPYLGRTLQLVGYEGELQFGLQEQPYRRMALPEFVARWSAGGDAVAFFDPGVWDAWRRRGLPGRVIAADNYTVAVSRL
ncbi:MAG TPA: phospholipid carrier-dependent glycosyltransferase [Steroidobacteraceae bacterium]